ncbi:MAG: hypothetical protein AAGC88_15370 [Bacteroidota bacterium]
MRYRLLFYLLTSSIFLVSWDNKAKVEAFDAQAIINQVESQVNSFHAADTTLNADGVVNLLWPEFTMLADGNYVEFKDVKSGSKTFMSSLQSFNTEWNELRIRPISPTHAISSFIFTDSIVAKDGTVTQSTGPNTFVWEKRAGVWKVLYGDADHYPVE